MEDKGAEVERIRRQLREERETASHAGPAAPAAEEVPVPLAEQTKKCPFCAEAIKAEAIVCRFCGRDLNAVPAAPAAAVAPQQPTAAAAPAKSGSNTFVGCLVILGVLAVPMYFGGCFGPVTQAQRVEQQQRQAADQAREAERAQRYENIDAFVMAQTFVEKHLKSPGSAKFPRYEDGFVQQLGDNRYRVTAYVDSENGFGALLRSNFTVVLKDLKDGNWQSEQVDVTPQQ